MSETRGFKALGIEEFKALPGAIRLSMLAHWAGKGEAEQAMAAAPFCPALKSSYSGIAPAAEFFEALARVAEPGEIKAQIARAKVDRAKAMASGNHRAREFDFGAVAAQALFLERPEAARVFVEGSEALVGVFDSEGGRESALSAAARLGDWDLARAIMKKSDQAFAHVFCGRGADVRLWKEALDDAPGVQEAAWPMVKGLVELAREVHGPATALAEDLQDALFFSRSAWVRDQSLALLGAAAREARVASQCAYRHGGAYRMLEKAIDRGDEGLLESVVQKIDLAKVDADLAKMGPSGGSALYPAIKAGRAWALERLLERAEEQKKGLSQELLSRGFWVWNSETNSARRKKGDALALCVAEGRLECAQAILRLSPKVDRAYAKAAVKYLAQLGDEAKEAGVAVSTWESLILSEIAPAREAPAERSAGAPAAPSRRRL